MSTLRHARDFRRVRSEGRRRVGVRVVTYLLPTEREVRAGFVCGRSVGGAVVRNRVRRQFKEAWRAIRPKAQGAFDVVFVARPQVVGAKTRDLIEEMSRALTEMGAMTA